MITEDQRGLLRRVATRIEDPLGLPIWLEDIAALLSLCANLGGAKDRAEHILELDEFGVQGLCERCGWTPEQWAEEWKKREGLDG